MLRKSTESAATVYTDILHRLFHNRGGGVLRLERLAGDSGEILLRVGHAREAFGLISVGEAKALSDHMEALIAKSGIEIVVAESEFSQPRFDEVRESSSPFNLLIGSRKFIEGWNCWRVSSLGLMNVGKAQGTQIIQLFGRGVRLKGYEWSLKRSEYANGDELPEHIHALETLSVFGIDAKYMDEFKKMLANEGLPGNENIRQIKIPLNVTYDFGKKLKMLRIKQKKSGGGRYEFKVDGPVPSLEQPIPDYLKKRKAIVDRYPRIEAIRSKGRGAQVQKESAVLRAEHLALLDFDQLYFDLERYKAERGWYNFNLSKKGIRQILSHANWYDLKMPTRQLTPDTFAGVRQLQDVALQLLKNYCERFYEYHQLAWTEPRLQIEELGPDDENIPKDTHYIITVDGNEQNLVQQLEDFAARMASATPPAASFKSLSYILNFKQHLFEPIFHVQRHAPFKIRPVVLNESEFEFVEALKKWCDTHHEKLSEQDVEIFLLRNLSRGKGLGFFEAGGFYPDFILWVLRGQQQFVNFVDPHGLLQTGEADPKIRFATDIKKIEQRLNDPQVQLNSFVLSPTKYELLNWREDPAAREALAQKHVLFMDRGSVDEPHYIDQLFGLMGALAQDAQHTALADGSV